MSGRVRVTGSTMGSDCGKRNGMESCYVANPNPLSPFPGPGKGERPVNVIGVEAQRPPVNRRQRRRINTKGTG